MERKYSVKDFLVLEDKRDIVKHAFNVEKMKTNKVLSNAKRKPPINLIFAETIILDMLSKMPLEQVLRIRRILNKIIGIKEENNKL